MDWFIPPAACLVFFVNISKRFIWILISAQEEEEEEEKHLKEEEILKLSKAGT